MKCNLCREEIQNDATEAYKAFLKKFDEYEVGDSVHICSGCYKKEQLRIKTEKVFLPAINQFASIANVMGFEDDKTNTKAILDAFTRQHRTLQSTMFSVIMNVIIEISELDDNMYFDPRNKWIKIMAKKATDAWRA